MVKLTLRSLVGTIKDKASQSRATMMAKPEALLSLLRATSHYPDSPPDPKHIDAVLALGRSSRAAASAVIEALMDRLARTRDANVALKCLITAHRVAASGGFILRDQLSIFPAAGGRNYLNVSNFRDASSPVAWELSTWVRWYGQYVECLVSVSRALGFFLSEKVSEPSSVTDAELVRETNAVVSLVEQICKQPDILAVGGNKLVAEIRVLVSRDCLAAMNEVRVRVSEFEERLSFLSFGDSVELVCSLKRLESCRERLGSMVSYNELGFKNELGFWNFVTDIKERVGKERDNRLLLLKPHSYKLTRNNYHLRTESARFVDRVPQLGNSLNFSSGRFSA